MILRSGLARNLTWVFLVAAAFTALLPCTVAAPKAKKVPKAFDPAKKSTRDLAIEEAMKCDANHNGRIDGIEVQALNAAYAADPKSWLYLFDDNGDKAITATEAANIQIPAPVTATQSPALVKDPVRPNQARSVAAKPGNPAPNKAVKPKKQNAPKAPIPAKPDARVLAFQEANKFDVNHNGRIDFVEGTALRAAFAAAPKGSLSFFDEDRDRNLSLAELAKIVLPTDVSAAQPPAAPNGVAAGKKQQGAKKKGPPKAFDPTKLSARDLAIEEARKCDTNHNGKIDFQEVTALRAAYAADPKSWLYLFDDDGNKTLSDSEVSRIAIPPPQVAAPATPAPKK